MGSLLTGVSRIRWGALRDALGAPAGSVPPLLSRIAYGDAGTGRAAVDELGDAVCALGFVVGEATAPTVPFLLELIAAPHQSCTAEVLELLERILRTDTWHASAAAAGRPEHGAFRQQPLWEVASRAAVNAGRPVVEVVAGSIRPDEAEAARRLLRAMDEVRPFPELRAARSPAGRGVRRPG
ncbi:hypothetical protein [Streptomyces sp. NPDC026673]|uniref:hypothetical protein n=1 Tax=Streptomyces sp. NPDC026673 TaxID=3155724 RepID=UPI0033EFE250